MPLSDEEIEGIRRRSAVRGVLVGIIGVVGALGTLLWLADVWLGGNFSSTRLEIEASETIDIAELFDAGEPICVFAAGDFLAMHGSREVLPGCEYGFMDDVDSGNAFLGLRGGRCHVAWLRAAPGRGLHSGIGCERNPSSVTFRVSRATDGSLRWAAEDE